jgi:hypothetical protein
MTIKQFNCLLLLLMLPAVALAVNDKGKFKREKKISRSFNVTANAGLNVNNKYGNVYVTTWDSNTTAIDVAIIVTGDKEETVTKRFNSIDVEFEGLNNLVNARTQIGNFSGSKVSIEINYTIKIPRKGSITIENQYGATLLGEINGKANITCKYGPLTLEALNSMGNVIKLQYSEGSKLGYVNEAVLNTSYSNVVITKANVLKANTQYTDLKILEVNDISLQCDFGDINLLRAGKVTAVGDYLTLKFGSIETLLNLTASFSKVQIMNIDKDVKNIAIYLSYTNIDIKYNENYPFDFEFYLRYASLSGAPALKFSEKNRKGNDAYYKGYNKSGGVNRMYIKTDYGNINFI